MVSDERCPRAWVEARVRERTEATSRGEERRERETMSGSRIVSASGVAADDDDDDEATTTTTTTMTTRDANADDEARRRRGAARGASRRWIDNHASIDRTRTRATGTRGAVDDAIQKGDARGFCARTALVEWRRDDGETLTFKTVSEFRLAVVRERTERKVDNGWDWVKYEGKSWASTNDCCRRRRRRRRQEARTSLPSRRLPRNGEKLDDDERMYSMNVKISNAPVREKRERRSASRGVFEAFDDRGQDLQMVTRFKYMAEVESNRSRLRSRERRELRWISMRIFAATKSSVFGRRV